MPNFTWEFWIDSVASQGDTDNSEVVSVKLGMSSANTVKQ